MSKIDVIAFYLPQYHPIPENDEWYGKGFTEWTNVGKAKPLFKGHYQPLVPSDLGYYDLRIADVRKQQAELAQKAGVKAFCYYHYWFGNGKQLLEMPLQEVVKSEEPDFPFCICWANHTWYQKMWSSEHNMLDMKPIMPQEYPGAEDWDKHFYTLLDTFKDERYYRIDGKLVFVLYHAADIPNVDAYIARWQELAQKEELGGFYFLSYVDDTIDLNNPVHDLCEAKVVCTKNDITSVGKNAFVRKLSRFIRSLLSRVLHMPMGVYKYGKVRKKLLHPCYKDEKVMPVLIPNWDNTARRGNGAMVLHNATPEEFGKHCEEVFDKIKDKQQQIVFLKSWNEWGEGNYMEPCLKYGHGYIDALRKALDK